jgi:ribosomal protein S18 acetylase RimI-like enzyme
MTADEERIEVSDWVDPADADFLDDRLNEFNFEATGYRDGRGLSIIIREPDGAIVAGLNGFSWGGTCKVRLLWVRADARGRGWGSRLLAAAEAEARARGCRHVTLSTHSFQAPDFYRARGYEIVGTVEDYPAGHRSYTLVKRLETAGKP